MLTKKMQTGAWITVALTAFVSSSSLCINLVFGAYSGYVRILIILLVNLITVRYLSRYSFKSKSRRLLDAGALGLFICIGGMFIPSALVGEAPLVATVYSAIPYFSFYCVSYLLLFIASDIKKLKNLLVFLVILCIFLSVGIFYDSTIGLTNTPIVGAKFAPVLDTIATVDATGSRRGAFFFGSATSVFPFLSIGTLSCILLKKKFTTNTRGSLLIASIFIIWFGYFFSLSRAPILLGTTLSLYAFVEVYFIADRRHWLRLSNKKILSFLFLIILVLSLGINHAPRLVDSAGDYQMGRLSQTLSASDQGNSHRFVVWIQGLKQFEQPEAWLGKGLGESNLRMKIQYRYEGQPQYESSLLFTFAEGGILGIIARLIPIVVIFSATQSTSIGLISLIWSFLIFLNLFASPLINGHSVQLAYFLGMALFVTFSSSLFETPKRRNRISPS